MTASDTRRQLADLFASQKLAVLATHCDGQPYTSLVGFAASDDLASLLFATTRATRKFKNLAADPRVALLIDDRSGGNTDFHEAIAVTAVGRAEELAGVERERCAASYLDRLPHLDGFIGSPTCALLRVEVERYLIVTRFQDVTEFRPRP